MKFYLYMHAHVTLASKGRMDLKGLLSTSIASAITAAERLLEKIGATDAHLNPVSTCSISECIPTSNKIFPLIPYLKHCGDLVWCMLRHMLTLCKRTITRRLPVAIRLTSDNWPASGTPM